MHAARAFLLFFFFVLLLFCAYIYFAFRSYGMSVYCSSRVRASLLCYVADLPTYHPLFIFEYFNGINGKLLQWPTNYGAGVTRGGRGGGGSMEANVGHRMV